MQYEKIRYTGGGITPQKVSAKVYALRLFKAESDIGKFKILMTKNARAD